MTPRTALGVPAGPRVPQVLHTDDAHLVTVLVPPGPPSAAAARELGHRLAALHAAGPGVRGRPTERPGRRLDRPGTDAQCGRCGLGVLVCRRSRAAYLRRACDAGDLSADETAVVERACDRLPSLGVPVKPPARLHGDLWSGNVLWSTGGAWLIDPAAHGGHRETDLAMLALFGCPYLDDLCSAHTDTTPLAAGRPARVPLHQLFPLLVRVVPFGRSYAGQATAAARAALRLG